MVKRTGRLAFKMLVYLSPPVFYYRELKAQRDRPTSRTAERVARPLQRSSKAGDGTGANVLGITPNIELAPTKRMEAVQRTNTLAFSNTKRCPEMVASPSCLCTEPERPSKPLRLSVAPLTKKHPRSRTCYKHTGTRPASLRSRTPKNCNQETKFRANKPVS